jgi:hypothetical protein
MLDVPLLKGSAEDDDLIIKTVKSYCLYQGHDQPYNAHGKIYPQED